jgi:hypothetical protein
MRSWIERNPRWTATRLALLAALLLSLASPAVAIEGVKGDLSWSWSNTVSYGLQWRLDDPDPDLYARSVPGGKALSANGDDGNLNYESGISSNAVKWTSELELRYKSVGAFVRAFALYDYENEEGDRDRTPLSDDALDRVGSRAEVRDAFVWWDFHLSGRPGTLRLGRQVINWGESTFIQGGINSINPVDVSALRVPGAELRDALLPFGAAMLSLKPSENTSFEVYYQYEWEETKPDPVGSYFSTSDLAGEGATKVMLGFGAAPDTIPIGAPIPGNPVGAVVPRAATQSADDGGQYGAALRFFLPGSGTELGFYYLNYHSRLPLIMARTGTLSGLLVSGNYAGSASYFLVYPEDIGLYGLSFNAELGAGIALQGEVSHKVDVPLQVDDVELLYAALSPLAKVPPLSPALAPVIGLGQLLAATNQLGAYGFDEVITGYKRFDISQIQMTATKVWSRGFGADQFTLVGEAAYSKVHDLPDQKELRLEAPGTYTSGNPIHTRPGLQPVTESASAFPTDTAWGYVIAARLDYNNIFGGPVNMQPRLSWAHDVDGISPGPGGQFLDGRKALTVGFGFNYQFNLEWDFAYTKYFGAGRYNLINDRDFLAANIKYSF